MRRVSPSRRAVSPPRPRGHDESKVLVEKLSPTSIDADMKETLDLMREIHTLENNMRHLHTHSSPGEFRQIKEAHLPTIEVKHGKAKIIVPHEMQESHWIQYIWAKDEHGTALSAVKLTASDPPRLAFDVSPGTTAITAYACCNQHGIWATFLQPLA